MKTSIINVRLNESIKEKLEFIGLKDDKPTSAVVRDAITFYIEKNNRLPIDLDENQLSKKDLPLLQSLGLTELIYWVMDKHSNSEIVEIDEFYLQLMDLISEMEQNSFFNNNILREFRKIYNELHEYLHEDTHNGLYFRFSENIEGFDYQKLNEFIHSLRYNKDNNRVIQIK